MGKILPRYNISRPGFFKYLSGKQDIPYSIFLKWNSLVGLSEFLIIEKEKFMKKTIPKIQLDKNLSEIIGVLNGDGHISRFKYEICVSGNKLEKHYLLYLKNLFESVFKIKFKISKLHSGLKLRAYSKELSEFLVNLGLPQGTKKAKLKIPSFIHNTPTFKKSYVRGLFDTDGAIYIRRKKEPVIEISNIDIKFLKQIKNLLLKLNFNFGLGKNKIYLYNKNKISHFFSEIKPANNKHLNKYEKYFNLSVGGPMAKTIAFH